MSRGVRKCRAIPGGSLMALRSRRLRSSEDREHVLLAEQRAAAGCAVTAEPAGRQPSINGPDIDAAESSDLAFCQKLLVVGVFMRHDFSPLRTARASALRSRATPCCPEFSNHTVMHRCGSRSLVFHRAGHGGWIAPSVAVTAEGT